MTHSKSVAVGLAVTLMFGASAFAENRHRNGTRERSVSRGAHTPRSERSTRAPSRAPRNSERRIEHDRDRSFNRNSDGRTWRFREDSSRSRSSRFRQPFFAHGRVSRFDRWNDGYRVWIGGYRYPFWVPYSYYDRYPFRVGVSLRLGGYYNPLGFYEYYDTYADYNYRRYNDYDRYVGSTLAAGTLRGVVESVDYDRGRFVLRNDATDNLVTVSVRDRFVGEMRPGDRVETSGDWSRSGLFVADYVDLIDRR